MLQAALLCLSFTLAPIANARGPRGELNELLAAVSAALESGADPKLADAHFRGTGVQWGAPVEVELLVSRDDTFLLQSRGELSSATCVGARGGWESDSSGAGWPLDLSRLERKRWLFAGLASQWLREDSGITCKLTDAPPAVEGTRELELSRADGWFHARLAIDVSTSLPRRMTIDVSDGTTTIELADWRAGPRRLWPGRVSVRESKGSEFRFELTSVAPLAGDADKRFAPPPRACADSRYSDEKPARVECRQSKLGFVFVKPLIDGRDVGWFLLDTGSGHWSLDRKVAETLELKPFGELRLVAASDSKPTRCVRAASFELGPLAVAQPVFLELDLGYFEAALDFRPAGIVGAELLRRAVVEVDLAAPEVLVHDPAKFTGEIASWTPVRFDARLPCVEAELEGNRKALFVIDTALQMALVLGAPYVEREKLLEGRATQPFTLIGVGSTSQALTGELEWLTLAGKRFIRVPAQFAAAGEGALDDPATAGIIGCRVLTHSRLVFDCANARMAFVARK